VYRWYAVAKEPSERNFIFVNENLKASENGVTLRIAAEFGDSAARPVF
jgi:hypothetical protein